MTQAVAQYLRQSAQQLAQAGDFVKAEAQLRAACAVWPSAPILHLEHGQLLEQLGQTHAATRSYFRAVMKARAKGVWLDDASVPPVILPQVLHAMAFAEQHRPEVLRALLDPLTAQFGHAALNRVRAALEIYLGANVTRPASPHQRPLFMYVPGLREMPYYDTAKAHADFPWLSDAQDAQPAIASEAAGVLASGQLQPFLDVQPGAASLRYLASTDSPDASGAPDRPASHAQWNAYFFYRHGQRFTEHLSACPATAALLARMPLVNIPGHAPEICFSVLAPGSHILPHTGVTNVRLVAHLPLILPHGCAIKVAGIERAWQLGTSLVFDDTFEHEAWNRASTARVILLMDVWHPDLSPEERLAFTSLIEGIGEFNRG
jgi:aspartate beta-hydroxylase